MHEETSPYFLVPTGSTWRPRTGYTARSTSLWVDREPLLVTVKRGKLAWFRHVTDSHLSKTTLQSTLDWRVAKAVVSRGNAAWPKSKGGYPCPCQNCPQGPPAEETAPGPLLNCPSCPPDNPISQGTEKHWLSSKWAKDHKHLKILKRIKLPNITRKNLG